MAGRRCISGWWTAREHGVEAILLAGDSLGRPDGFETPEEAQRYEAQTVTGLLEAAGVPVLYIMGNDDLVELDSRSTHVQSIHARRTTLGAFSLLAISIRCRSWAVFSKNRRPALKPTWPPWSISSTPKQSSCRIVRRSVFSIRASARAALAVTHCVGSWTVTHALFTSMDTATRDLDASGDTSTSRRGPKAGRALQSRNHATSGSRSGASRDMMSATGAMDTHEHLARQTIELARQARAAGNHPFGALLAIDGEVVLTATNTVKTDRDPTAHAESNLPRRRYAGSRSLRSVAASSTPAVSPVRCVSARCTGQGFVPSRTPFRRRNWPPLPAGAIF